MDENRRVRDPGEHRGSRYAGEIRHAHDFGKPRQTRRARVRRGVRNPGEPRKSPPCLESETIAELLEKHEKDENDITVFAVNLEKPTGYGRMVTDNNGNVLKIVEESDADPLEKEIKIINSGIYPATAGSL